MQKAEYSIRFPEFTIITEEPSAATPGSDVASQPSQKISYRLSIPFSGNHVKTCLLIFAKSTRRSLS